MKHSHCNPQVDEAIPQGNPVDDTEGLKPWKQGINKHLKPLQKSCRWEEKNIKGEEGEEPQKERSSTMKSALTYNFYLHFAWALLEQIQAQPSHDKRETYIRLRPTNDIPQHHILN